MNHRYIIRSLTLLLSLFVVAGTVCAQPDVEIYWDETDKLDTVIDFDVTLEGFPVYRTFTVRNRSAYAVTIPTKFAPYFIIQNTTDVPPSHPRKEEFDAEDPFPHTVPANSARSFKLVFLAFKDNGLFPPDTITEALLFLRVVAASNQTGPGVDKTFLLRALKTTRPLASSTKVLAFDSVYIRPNPVPTLKYRIKNVTQATIRVDSQITKPRTPLVTSEPELKVTAFSQVLFTGRDSVEWTATYVPEDQGRDSITFVVYYKANDTSPTDSVVLAVSGVGVEQRIVKVKAEGIPKPIADFRDTSGGIIIDFGELPANGAANVATIVVRNTGNLNLGYDDERHVGADRDTTAFPIRQRWSGGRGRGSGEGDFDTLVVAFAPTSSGDHRSAYVLTTDIKRRNIKGIPDGANTYTVFLRGFGQRPQLQAPASIDFGTIVYLPSCASNIERSVRIANVGNAVLLVDSLTVAPGVGLINLNTASNFSINPGSSVDISVLYTAVAVGRDSGTITLWTNALTSRVDIVYSAIVVPRDSTTVALPTTITSRPGSVVSIPVLIESATVGLTNVTSFTLAFDPSLLRFSKLRTQGTASEGATVIRAEEAPRGILNVTLDKNGNFVDSDTLVNLWFDTFLGSQASTELALANETTTFGNDGCTSVLDVRTTSGVFALDSICGLSYKTSGGIRVLQAAVYPNPAADAASIAVIVRDSTAVTINLRDALGRSVLLVQDNVVQAGSRIIPLDLRGLQSATYYLEVRSTFSNRTIPLVVRP